MSVRWPGRSLFDRAIVEPLMRAEHVVEVDIRLGDVIQMPQAEAQEGSEKTRYRKSRVK
jgi:hypothetical protein